MQYAPTSNAMDLPIKPLSGLIGAGGFQPGITCLFQPLIQFLRKLLDNRWTFVGHVPELIWIDLIIMEYIGILFISLPLDDEGMMMCSQTASASAGPIWCHDEIEGRIRPGDVFAQHGV